MLPLNPAHTSAPLTSLDELRSSFRLEPLEPFGLKIVPMHRENLSRIPAALLNQLVRMEKLVLLRGFEEIPRDDFLAYCRSYPGRQLLEWDFGPVMELREGANPKNYLFSRERVPFHWDGAFHRVPAYLVFCSVEAPTAGAGGETLFTNTERIWDDATEEDRSFWSRVELQYETAKMAHYGGSTTAPLVQTHPDSGHPILRFAEAVNTKLNPVSLTIRGIPEPAHQGFLTDMEQRIYHSRYCYAHAWEPGDILIADNHALIHGRHVLKHDCPRHLRRIQLI